MQHLKYFSLKILIFFTLMLKNVYQEELKRYRHEFVNLKIEANTVAAKWSITPEFSKTRQRKIKRHFDELCEDERLQDPESLFKVNISN
uniref:Putative secreted protein n=1 Tax=Xenopsylla cheopis TaxID=163159 RepID=A0A6M2DXZ6_XENCH